MLETAIEAASEAAKLLKKNFGSALNVNQATQHDIKLEIDELSQQLIARIILADYPDHCILGEESSAGNPRADVRWVVDPLDGTVNYFYGIPHYAVSIAAQERRGDDQWETVTGVVLEPELDELFATEKGKPAMLHGRPIHVSNRTQLSEAIVAIGISKSLDAMNRGVQDFGRMIYQVRKLRLTGSAALDTVCASSTAFGSGTLPQASSSLKTRAGASRARRRPNRIRSTCECGTGKSRSTNSDWRRCKHLCLCGSHQHSCIPLCDRW